nr:hypothetical transcript [Hymenolepis microstoma]
MLNLISLPICGLQLDDLDIFCVNFLRISNFSLCFWIFYTYKCSTCFPKQIKFGKPFYLRQQLRLGVCSFVLGIWMIMLTLLLLQYSSEQRELGCSNLPVCHKTFRKHLDSTVNHLTELMVNNREFLEKIKAQKSLEMNQLETSQNEAQDSATDAESNINAAIGNWINTRLGTLTLSDSSHVVLDASESTLLMGNENKSSEVCDRIRGQIKQPLGKGSSFGFNSLHPLRGSIEDMEVAKIAVRAMTPSVLASHLIWKQVEDLNC